MRSVDIVKTKRNELEEKVSIIREKIHSLYDYKSFVDLNGIEKKEFHFLNRILVDLLTQINALNFVLNEDCELKPAYEKYENFYSLEENF